MSTESPVVTHHRTMREASADIARLDGEITECKDQLRGLQVAYADAVRRRDQAQHALVTCDPEPAP